MTQCRCVSDWTTGLWCAGVRLPRALSCNFSSNHRSTTEPGSSLPGSSRFLGGICVVLLSCSCFYVCIIHLVQHLASLLTRNLPFGKSNLQAWSWRPHPVINKPVISVVRKLSQSHFPMTRFSKYSIFSDLRQVVLVLPLPCVTSARRCH